MHVSEGYRETGLNFLERLSAPRTSADKGSMNTLSIMYDDQLAESGYINLIKIYPSASTLNRPSSYKIMAPVSIKGSCLCGETKLEITEEGGHPIQAGCLPAQRPSLSNGMIDTLSLQ